jgi:hypothetical protein
MMDKQHERQTVTAEEMVYSNMLAVNAIVELLDVRGILPKKDVLERIKLLQSPMENRRHKLIK